MFFAQILQVLSIEMFNFLAGIVEKKEERNLQLKRPIIAPKNSAKMHKLKTLVIILLESK